MSFTIDATRGPESFSIQGDASAMIDGDIVDGTGQKIGVLSEILSNALSSLEGVLRKWGLIQ